MEPRLVPTQLIGTDCVVFQHGIEEKRYKIGDLAAITQDPLSGNWVFRGRLLALGDGFIELAVVPSFGPPPKTPAEARRISIIMRIPHELIKDVFFPISAN